MPTRNGLSGPSKQDVSILSPEDQLRYVLSAYVEYYHQERIHQGVTRIFEHELEMTHVEPR